METKSVENSDSSLPKTRTGKQCAVKDCSNCFYDSQGNPTGLHFFKFPSVPVHRRTRWCNLIGRQHKRDGFEVTKSTVVCEKHFKKHDIKIAFGSRRWNLCEGAVPSLCLPKVKLYETTKRTPPKERLHIRTPPSKKKKFSQLASTETKATSSQFCDIGVQTDIIITSIMEQANLQSDVSAADLMAHNIRLVEKEVVVPLCSKIVELEKKIQAAKQQLDKVKKGMQ